MKNFIFLFLISSTLFSQKIIIPVEEKGNHLINNYNIDKYEFRDVNNVFDKFKGKWSYNDSIHKIVLDVQTFYDIVNRQDAIGINMLLIKNSDTLINTLCLEDIRYSFIRGGFFGQNKDKDLTSVIMSDILEVYEKRRYICGNVTEIDLTYIEPNRLIWKNKTKRFSSTKTSKILPNSFSLTKF